jgi:hypothetical protein
MNPKKKSRRYRASVSIQALDLAISRFTNSLACRYIFAFKFTLKSQQPDIVHIICHRCH